MDAELMQKLNLPDGLSGEKYSAGSLGQMDDHAAAIEIDGSGERYALKPLRELYGKGTGSDTLDPQDQRFMPLFLAIEEQIARHFQSDPRLTDGAVELMLDAIAMDPETPSADPLARSVQSGLRLCLSLNDYSRNEVKAALKKVRKSVDRHTRAAGPRGYLQFIVRFFGQWKSGTGPV